jgi:mono/diheme cytochrome c family protein
MRQIVVMAVAALAVVACGKEDPKKTAREAAGATLAERPFSTESLFNGVRLFQEHCAQCHGPEAQGHPDWQNPKVRAAPPLNGTGNDWKRRKQEMIAIIKNGAKRNGHPVMPAWKGRLTDQEIEDIISWYQALWPAEVYERWRKANASATAPKV